MSIDGNRVFLSLWTTKSSTTNLSQSTGQIFLQVSKKKDKFICVEVIIFKMIFTETLVNVTIYHHD